MIRFLKPQRAFWLFGVFLFPLSGISGGFIELASGLAFLNQDLGVTVTEKAAVSLSMGDSSLFSVMGRLSSPGGITFLGAYQFQFFNSKGPWFGPLGGLSLRESRSEIALGGILSYFQSIHESWSIGVEFSAFDTFVPSGRPFRAVDLIYGVRYKF